MKIETILLAFLIGLHLAVIQFGFLLNLQVHVSSTYLTYMIVVLSWFCGSLIGLWTNRLGLKSGVLVSTAAYYVSYGIVAANPFSRLTIVLSALCVVIAGLWAGRFFTLFIQRFKQSDSLFLHENNGFLVGIISFFVGFTLLGKSFLLLMPGFLAILILSMGNHPSAPPTPESKSKGKGTLLKPIWVLGLSAFCSGSAALIYETLWARSFSLIFGSTVQANAAVFAGFIVGLAIGAAVYGRWTRKSTNPVRLYGLVEFGIAVSAILVGMVLFQFRNTWIIGGEEKGFLFIMQTVGVVVLLILVPAGLMGGTLPILLHLARKLVDDAAVVGRIYSFNVLGAAFGALLCGFYTIPKLGIIQSHFAAGTLNVIAGVLVLGLKLNLDRSNKVAQKKVMTEEASVATVTHPEWFLVLAVFISGFAVYSVEILWSRLAQYFIGNRIFAFSILLSAVLCLLAIGSMVSSLLIRKYRDQLADSLGFMVLASALGLLLSSWGSHQLILHQEQWEMGFPGMGKGLLVYRFLETFVVLGPALITLGVLFPVCLVLSKRSDQDIAASTGRYYVLNAVGSVIGSLATGFFLLKIFGVYRSMLLLICLLVVAADVFFVYSYLKGRKPQAMYGIGAGMLVILMGLMALPSQLILLKDGDKLVHRLEDEYGIFQVAQLPEPQSGLKRVTNNRTELVFYYGSKYTRRVQGMQAHLGMLYNPGAVNAAVLGSGYGITAGELSLYPQLKRIDAVEILPGMIEAADLFSPHNRDYHKKANVRVIQDDGRHYLVASDLKYDLVSINVSDPHTPGSGSLYHADFLEIIKSRLNPNGVVVLHPFGEDCGLQLRTIAHVFPYWLAFKAYSNGYNLIASADPLQYDTERVKVMVASNPEIGKSLKRFNYVETQGKSRLDFEEFFKNPSLICTDNHPLLEYSLKGSIELILTSNE